MALSIISTRHVYHFDIYYLFGELPTDGTYQDIRERTAVRVRAIRDRDDTMLMGLFMNFESPVARPNATPSIKSHGVIRYGGFATGENAERITFALQELAKYIAESFNLSEMVLVVDNTGYLYMKDVTV